MAVKFVLPEDVAVKYTCTSGNFRFNMASGDVDLRKISLAEADRLYEKGFPFLVLRKVSAKKGDAA